MGELRILINGDTLEVWLSVDGQPERKLSLVEYARLLSDLALATSATILADYQEQATLGHVPMGTWVKGEC